jgi:hypothetical protein
MISCETILLILSAVAPTGRTAVAPSADRCFSLIRGFSSLQIPVASLL